ncbi:TetR/AcrR family transcriptional regulator [Pikeienuella piscinae]|uniref:TetR/AcrR family transcriptional regulator n=1 Tax=Pikeienuella piscinae TaxID=2748098 RepID=A0A7M3T5R7_9RHOB|nr:TetR/AcrR family transcriptional regulator [Pikeienuella piscinae]QIE57348.1 TetR/AcrR family transcriptional regulator [Pikeienuella piscinae]
MARQAGSKGEETAARIRAAATGLFARHGYAAVSMREIASEVGVGAGAIYNHFTTKQDLLVGLMVGHMTDLLAAWDAEPMAAADAFPAAALEAFARFHIRFHRQRIDEVFVSYMELRSLDQPNFHRVERLRRAYEDRLEGIIARGVAAGAFHAPEPKVAALAIIAMLTGITGWYRQGGRLPASTIEALYVEMVAATVRPKGGPD